MVRTPTTASTSPPTSGGPSGSGSPSSTTRVASLRDAQRDLLVPADDTETRLRQLERLLGLLDEQLSLVN